MKKIEHIGIAVNDIKESNILFSKIFGKEAYKCEQVDSEGVITSFFEMGESKIELVAATTDTSPIKKFLSNHSQGLHHIAFFVDDIKLEMDRLRSEGIRLLNETPKNGSDNKLICFLNPKDTHGVLIEICQEIN